MDESSEEFIPAEPAGVTGRPFESYVHDQQNAEVLALVLDGAHATSTLRWNVVDDIRREGSDAGLDPEGPEIRELVLATAYGLRLSARGEPSGCALGPLSGSGANAYPPAVPDVGDEVVALWRDLAEKVQHPGAKARLNDLLFLRRDGNPYVRATAAIDAYLADVDVTAEVDLTQAQGLVRAWDLARSVGDLAREVTVRGAMLSAAENTMKGESKWPGVVLPLIGALSTKPKESKKSSRGGPAGAGDDARIDALLEEAWRAYDEGWLRSELADYLRRRAQTPDESQAANRREAQAYIDEALSRPGLVRLSILESAVRVARDYGLTDLVERATALMQAIPKADLGLVVMSTSVSIPPDYIERWLAPFTTYSDWRFGLEYFLITDCPSGDLATLKSQTEQIAKTTGFLLAISSMKLNADGLPRWTSTPDDGGYADRLAETANHYAVNRGRLLATGLVRMAERYGVPSESELMVTLSRRGAADPTIAASVARAFIHFWKEDYEACVHIAAARFESAARLLLRELDEGIYRTQAAGTPGGYPGLYVLLKKLDELALDESWAYFLRWLLAAPEGPNLRNEIAHGFVTRIGPGYAALILRALTLLSTVVAPQAQEWAEEKDGIHPLVTSIADPVAPRSREDLLKLLGKPVPVPAVWPARPGVVGRLARGGATATRMAAVALAALSRRLEGGG